MIAIEIKRIIKDSLVIFLILIALLLAMFTTGKEDYLAPILEVFLLLYASFTGWSMFERERQEGAMEYLLSLPASKTRLFMLKLIPRAAVVFFVLFLYYFIHDRFAGQFVLSYFVFALFFITVFLLSLALSLSMKNFLAGFFLTLFFSTGLYFLVRFLDFSKNESSAASQAALSFLVVPLLFFFMFKRFDIKPIYHFNIRFVPALVITILLVFGITYITTGTWLWNCFITAEGHVLKTFPGRAVLIKRDNQKIVFKDSFAPLLEDQGKLYAGLLNRGNGLQAALVRVDLESGTMEKLFETEPGWWFHFSSGSGVRVGERIFFLLTSRSHKEYRILELKDKDTKVVDVKADFGEEDIHFIAGAVDNPLQFIVFTESRVFRIFGDGETEQLFVATAVNTWGNRLLIFTDKGMNLYEIAEDLKPVFQKEGEIKKIRRGLEDVMQQRILVKIDNIFYIFDMETQNLDRVAFKRIPYSYVATEKGLRIIDIDKSEISVSDWKDGRLRPEKTWYSEIDSEELRFIRVFSAGVVVFNRKECEIYRFVEDRDKGGGD